jgi:hypothetical protein
VATTIEKEYTEDEIKTTTNAVAYYSSTELP